MRLESTRWKKKRKRLFFKQMTSRKINDDPRARQLLAQEAARIIVDQGIRDYRLAKIKAANRLGLTRRGSLPRNSEIEDAIGERLQLFGRDLHSDFLRTMREAAISVMELLVSFTPRLVGPVLSGTADTNSPINLHVFSDSSEMVAMRLAELDFSYRAYEQRLRSRRSSRFGVDTFAGFRFHYDDTSIEATVFPVDGIRQAPISPIDGKPIRRADAKAVRDLLS